MSGIACNLDSRGFQVLCKATTEVVGHVEPYSITGSLPLIRELQVQCLSPCIDGVYKPSSSIDPFIFLSFLQDEGFDVQTTGYGKKHLIHSEYHISIPLSVPS